MSSAIKHFNQVVASGIQVARRLEDENNWPAAKQQWLDVVEYCLLFVKKTPGLSDKLKRLIVEKSDAFVARVKRIEEKIKVEKLDYEDGDEATLLRMTTNFPSTPASETEPPGDDASHSPHPFNEEAFDEQDDVASIETGEPAGAAPVEEQIEGEGEITEGVGDGFSTAGQDEINAGGGRSITVGDTVIDIPDDFPLIEITPPDSFKPASVEHETMEIDKTSYPVENGVKGEEEDNSGEQGEPRDEDD